LDIDADLKQAEHDLAHLVDRMLDDLYWVMSYARWRDPRFWPLFRDEILKSCPEAAPADLEAARQYNFERYRHQGIGRFEPEEVYARGVADLGVLARLINDNPFFFGEKPHGVDAAIFGFLANIYFYEIETPLKRFVAAAPGLARHCERIRALTA
jgi:glutathione S-transferase